VKDSFYEELERVFVKFSKYRKKILLGDLNPKVCREDIFKPFKIITANSTMFKHHYIHKYTWTSPDGKTHNQINHILVDRRRHCNVLDVR
jgi:exonuclease III